MTDHWQYKFKPLDRRTLDMIEANEFYFAPPDSLNDPFEGDLHSENNGRIEELLLVFDKCVDAAKAICDRDIMSYRRFIDDQSEPRKGRSHPYVMLNFGATGHRPFIDLVTQTERRLNGQLSSIEPRRAVGILSDFYRELRSLANRQFGIFCVGGDPASILMWSHYAANHTGVAICIDGTTQVFRKTPGISCHMVEYRKDRAIDIASEGWPMSFIKLFTTKHLQWAYERETRYICHHGAGTKALKAHAIRGIILGCRFRRNMDTAAGRSCVERLESAIYETNCRRPNGEKLQVYTANKSADCFALSIVRLSDPRQIHRVWQDGR